MCFSRFDHSLNLSKKLFSRISGWCSLSFSKGVGVGQSPCGQRWSITCFLNQFVPAVRLSFALLQTLSDTSYRRFWHLRSARNVWGRGTQEVGAQEGQGAQRSLLQLSPIGRLVSAWRRWRARFKRSKSRKPTTCAERLPRGQRCEPAFAWALNVFSSNSFQLSSCLLYFSI